MRLSEIYLIKIQIFERCSIYQWKNYDSRRYIHILSPFIRFSTVKGNI